METRRSDIFRSVLEGITMNLGLIVDVYRQNGYALPAIHVIGGGARDTLWCQMMADIWQTDIQRLNHLDEATSMGAAVTAGVGAGLYKDFNVIDQYIAVADRYHPDPSTAAAYQQARQVFDACYQALLPVFPQLVG